VWLMGDGLSLHAWVCFLSGGGGHGSDWLGCDWQVIGDLYDVYDVGDHAVLMLGRDGLLFAGALLRGGGGKDAAPRRGSLDLGYWIWPVYAALRLWHDAGVVLTFGALTWDGWDGAAARLAPGDGW
jgi:hypothetical protein